jgi:hypothetical protein
MSDVKLDLTPGSPTYKDFLIVDGDLVIVTGKSEIQQNILQRLSTYYGEWFMNTQIGIPYFDQILVKDPDQSKVDALLFNTIAGTPGVIAVLSYSFTADFLTRTLNVAFSAQTTQGTVDYEGQVAA